MAQTREPEHIQDVLQKWARGRGIRAELVFYSIATRWQDLVGETVARRTRPDWLHQGVLTVVAATSSWVNELRFMKGELARRINERLGEELVKDIRLKVGRVVPERPRPLREPDAAAPPARRKVSRQEELLVRREIADRVADPELREAIVRARLAQLRTEGGG